jgi:hypothetical protein
MSAVHPYLVSSSWVAFIVRYRAEHHVMVVILGSLSLPGKLSLAGSKRARQTELCMYAFNTVDGVEVLDKGDLEARSRALARGNRRVCKKVFPNLSYV